MAEDVRRIKMKREFEQEFLPNYDAANMPSADKRAAYALEHIAFRMSRIDEKLERLVAAVEAIVVKE